MKLKTKHVTVKPHVLQPLSQGEVANLQDAQIAHVVTKDYAGNIIYENGNIDKILFPGGYTQFEQVGALLKGTDHFYNKDYLGNNRDVVRKQANATELVQRTEYFPFGTPFPDESWTGSVQPYKYNGKEFDRMHGLNYYDYGARHYDPLLGRWHVMDPLDEKYYSVSPYAYCLNNPVRYKDPTGKEGIKYTDENGNKIIESNIVVLVEQKKSIPQNATTTQIAKIEKQNTKIEKSNNERIVDVKQRLSDTYNGSNGKGTKNSLGETVKFKFNVSGVETADTKGGTTRQIREIATAHALKTSQKDFGGNNIKALAAVVTTRPTEGSLGLSNGIYVTEALNSPQTTLSHEIGHTLKLNDNYPNSTGGLMDYPPGGLISSEVDEIWRNAYEK